MSIKPSQQAHFDFASLNQARNAEPRGDGGFAVQLAAFQSQTLNTLISAALGGKAEESGSATDLLDTGASDSSNPLIANGKLSASGRNLGLFDPESGYRMMSVINQREISYQAEFAALSEMKQELKVMAAEGGELAELADADDRQKIQAELQEFVDEYNDWVAEFDDEMAAGGALSNSKAAQVSRYELEQSIADPFAGASYGWRGLQDLGLSIDPLSKRAKLDSSKLDAALNQNQHGVIATLHAFSQRFTGSAELLNSNNNFVENRLSNLNRVISYINENKSSLQAEFGLGDVAKPNAQLQAAIAAYRKMQGKG